MKNKESVQVKVYINARASVYLHYNNEMGHWTWAVGVRADPGFWLKSFTTKKSAESFCKRNELPIVLVINDRKK